MWWYLWIFIPAAVAVWLIYEWYEHTVVQYKTTIVECQKIPQTKEIRLCLISDLHNNRKKLMPIKEHICEFSPEFVLFAGDMVNKHKEENNHALRFMEELSELKLPMFYSAGNHELTLSEEHPEAWAHFLSRLPSSVQYLENTSVFFDDRLCISGLSLPKAFYQKGNLYENQEEMPRLQVPENCFHIMMAHNPEYAKLYDRYRANLIVSGHLHGGLLRLPKIGGVISPRLRLPEGCDAGHIQLTEESHMFVSRGLGSHTVPLRFFNRVEVNFLVLKGTKDKK